MAYLNKSNLDAVKKLQNKVNKDKKEKKEKQATSNQTLTITPTKEKSRATTRPAPQSQSSASTFSNKSDPIAVRKLQNKVAQQRATKPNKTLLGNTQTTSFATETNNAYTNAKNKTKNKTTITSNLTEEERTARIKEINIELNNLNTKINGYSRAKVYGTNESLEEAEKKDKERVAELSKELKTLERTGTFTDSELKQFEIDDAKKKVASARQKVESYGQRPSPDVAEEWRAAISEQFKAQNELDYLERQKTLYDDISKFGDVVNEDTFIGQWKANYRSKNLDIKSSKAFSEYMNNPTEENREIAMAYDAFVKEYTKNNEKALDDEGEVLPLFSKSFAGYLPQLADQAPSQIAGGVTGLAIGSALGVPKIGWTAGASIGSGINSYNVIRGSLFGELISYGIDEETAYKMANDDAIIESLIESGETAADWALMLSGKVFGTGANALRKTATKAAKNSTKSLLGLGLDVGKGVVVNSGQEYGEEFLQGAVSRATREKAWAMIDNEIGQYGKGNIDLYNRPVYKNPDGTLSTVDSVTVQIDDKFVLLPSIVKDENGNPKRLEETEDIVAHYVKTGEYLGEFDTLEEANIYANKLHYAQAYKYSQDTSVDADDSTLVGGVKVLGDAVFGGNKEALGELHEQGVEGFKVGFVGGSVRAVASNAIFGYQKAKTYEERNKKAENIARNDEKLDAIVAVAKSAGEGTVAYEIAQEVETARKSGEVKGEQVKKLIAATSVYVKAEKTQPISDTLVTDNNSPIREGNELKTPKNTQRSTTKGMTLVERLETQSQNNETLAVEDVKKATGFGDKGAELTARLANSEGITFSQAEKAVKIAYNAGFTDLKAAKVNFENNLQKAAFDAGKIDRGVQDRVAKANAKNATIYDGAFTENERTKKFTKTERKMISIFAEGLAMDISTVDEIIASETLVDGKKIKHYANASHEDGKMQISSDVGRILYKMVMHEGGHRMKQLAPDKFGVLMNALYKRAVRRSAESGVSQSLIFDNVKAEHDNAGITMDTSGYFEEFAVRELETIFSSAREFNKWYAEISGNRQLRNSFERFIDWVIEVIDDIKRAFKYSKMSTQEKAEARRVLAELEHIKDLYAKVWRAAENTVAERRSEKQVEISEINPSKNLEIKVNEDYNASVSHSLKSPYNEYNTIGMQWAYDSHTQVGDLNVLYNKYTGKYVLAEATKEGISFIELKSGTYKQMRKDEKIYESNKERKFDDDERAIDTAIHNFRAGQNNNTGNNVDAGNGGKGVQNAEVSEGKSNSNKTTDTQAIDENLSEAQSDEVHNFEKDALKESGVKYSIKKHFNKQVDEAIENTLGRGYRVYVGKTPIWIAKCGFNPEIPMLMNQNHIRNINHKKDPKNRHYHGLGRDIIKQIPKELNDPVMIYDSITPEPAERKNAVCVVTKLKDGDLPIIISLKANETDGAKYYDVTLETVKTDLYNFVASEYGKDDFFGHIEDVINQDALLYANKNKTLKLFSDSGLELPTRLNNLGFDKIIHQSRNIVNTYSTQKTENNSQSSNSVKRNFSLKESINISTKNLEKNKNTGYNEYWKTDLSKSQIKEVEKWLRQEDNPDEKKITDTANWYKGRINGEDVFVVYSTEDANNPTILYEIKGGNAKVELNILTELLEEIKNGESNDGKSAYVNWVSGGGWMQKVNNSKNNLGNLGRGQNNQNAGVLQSQSQRNGSPAFWNVLKNLFGRQEQDGKLNKDRDYSLKSGVSATELLDTIDDMRNGKKKAVSTLSGYVDRGAISTELYEELIEKYGSIPKGEKPHRDIQVPRKTAKDKKVSQTVRTILEAKATPDEAVPTIEKMVEEGTFSYDVYTDKQAINDADSYIKEYGWDKSLMDWFSAVEKGVVSKEHTAIGWALYNNAANIAATTTSETERTTAINTSLNILDAMVRHQRSAAQALQATRILKKLSPETQLYGVQKSIQALRKELVDKYGDKAPNLKIDEELAEQYLKAETQEEREAIEKEIYKDIGRQIPSRFIDKWNAVRYVAMLANARTHFRNIVGNAAFAPVVIAKDLTATAIETVVYRVSGQNTVRGKALIVGSKADRELLKAAWSDYANVADIVSNGGKYSDHAMANQYIEEGRKIFKSKTLERIRKTNSDYLEKEDVWFSKPHYAYALAQYCKANNITAEQIKNGKAIRPARVYAIKEAQKATYKDTNEFSQWVSSFGRRGKNNSNIEKVVGPAVEGVLPYRRTPANILVRGVEYSPYGLLKGLSYDLVKVSKGEMTVTEAIDNISAGLTGTGLLALGVFLAAQGLIRGHGEDDEEEREFKELMGHQAYALELPNGESRTLDWLAPEALPFFVGVNLWEATKGSGEKVNLSSILRAISNITEPMLEMSCLQSLNDLVEGIGYASDNDMSGITAILASATTSYLTQSVPTLLGQAERTGEENRMTTYIEKNDFLTKGMQYTLGKISSKIPFVDYRQIPYIDAWGRKEASGTALKRGFNNFLNPAYTSTINESDMEKELLRIYEKTGDNGVFPERADKYFIVDGVRKDLTAEEYVRYATLKGEKSYKAVTDLVKSKAYKKLTDSEKAKAVQEAYTYADQKAKQAVGNYKPDSWVKKADEFGSNIGNYISFRTNVSSTKKDNGDKISKQEVVDIILDMAQNDSETWKMYLSMYDSDKDMYAYNKGIGGETYMYFLDSLNDVDRPTESGKYGTYTQEEAYRAIRQLDGLSQKEKAVLWQSVNTSWKASKNPFR